jgi:hypothetical protein
MRSMVLFFLAGLSMISFMTGCNNHSKKTPVISEALKKESIEVLRTILQTHSEWVKVHAAEFLIGLGYPEGVQEIYLNEEKQYGNKSPYRIGIWRVLSKAATEPQEKEIWTEKIMQAFLDTTGVDRIHAAETLAKLHISPLLVNPEITTKTLYSHVRNLSLYTRWSTAFSSKDSLLNVRKFFLDIAASGTEDAPSRRLAAYVIRHSGDLPPSEWKIFAQSALSEPEESGLKINLLNAAVITAQNDTELSGLYKQVYKAIIKYKNSAEKNIRLEIAAGLAEKGKMEDLSILISFLKNEHPLGKDLDDADVRASAAYAILRMSVRQNTN